jgi:hypothetical protein
MFVARSQDERLVVKRDPGRGRVCLPHFGELLWSSYYTSVAQAVLLELFVFGRVELMGIMKILLIFGGLVVGAGLSAAAGDCGGPHPHPHSDTHTHADFPLGP